jgi:hypothetical protein
MRRQVRASENASSAIRAIGRTEDVQFSPSNSRLAIAGLLENAILILNYRSPSGHGVVELSAPVLFNLPASSTPTDSPGSMTQQWPLRTAVARSP